MAIPMGSHRALSCRLEPWPETEKKVMTVMKNSSVAAIHRNDPDPVAPPWFSSPRGLLLAVLEDADHAGRAVAALRGAGFSVRALRVYAGEQILDDYRRYTAQRNMLRRTARALTVDQESTDLHLGYARDGCSAVWIHVPDDEAANRAVRTLAGSRSLYFRHYGRCRQRDIIIRRPTS